MKCERSVIIMTLHQHSSQVSSLDNCVNDTPTETGLTSHCICCLLIYIFLKILLFCVPYVCTMHIEVAVQLQQTSYENSFYAEMNVPFFSFLLFVSYNLIHNFAYEGWIFLFPILPIWQTTPPTHRLHLFHPFIFGHYLTTQNQTGKEVLPFTYI